MPAGGLAIAGIGAAIGGVQAILAARQKKKLAAQAAALQRPVYQQSPYENQALTLAESQGDKGISDASRTAYMNDADTGLNTSINAIEKGGGDVNTLGSAYGKYTGGLGQLAMYDDSAHQKNIDRVLSAYARQSANDDKTFMFNKYAPYADQKAALMQQMAGATNMEQAGLNTLGSSFGSAGGSLARLAGAGGGMPAMPSGGGPNVGSMGGMAQPMPDGTGGGNGGYYGSGYNGSYIPVSSFGSQPSISPDYPIGGATNAPGGTNSWGWQ